MNSSSLLATTVSSPTKIEDEFPVENNEATKKLSTPFQSWMTTAKLCFGNAYLSIPNVFTFTGWLGGAILFGAIGSINIYTMHQNLHVAEKFPGIHSYSEMVFKVYGKWGKRCIDTCIYIVQFSTCISYLYFIAEQIDGLVCFYSADAQGLNGYCDHKNLYITLLTIPALPCSWITTYTFLSYFSMAGIGLAVLALAMMTGYMIEKAENGNSVVGEVITFDFIGVAGHIGVAMFIFEGNAAVLNVRAEASD